MVSTLWVFSVLTVLLHLPLSSLAVPTEPVTTDTIPSLDEVLKSFPRKALSNTGDNRQCIARGWLPIKNTLLFETNPPDGPFIFLVETTIGTVLCFVPSDDMDQMIAEEDSPEDPDYERLYLDRLLGTDGQLTRAMRQLLTWQNQAKDTGCLPSPVLIGVQIAARGLESSVHHEALIEKMVSGLKNNLQAFWKPLGEQPDLKLKVHPYKKYDPLTVAVHKSFTAPSPDAEVQQVSHVGRVWIQGTYGDQKGPVADITFESPVVGYPDPSKPLLLAFTGATIDYRVEGLAVTVPLAPAPKKPLLLLLKEESDKPQTALTNPKYTKWLEYQDGTGEIKCDHVPWDEDGSLLGYMNQEKSPLIMIQTSVAGILCSIPNTAWSEMSKKYKSLVKSLLPGTRTELINDYTRIRDALFKSLPRVIKESGKNFRILGSQFWAHRSHKPKYIPPMVKDVLDVLSGILREAMESSEDAPKDTTYDTTHDAIDNTIDNNDCSDSDFTVQPYLSITTTLSKLNTGSDKLYSAMWLPPFKDEAQREVWIWTPGATHGWPKVGGKSPIATLDLLKSKDPYKWLVPPADLDAMIDR